MIDPKEGGTSVDRNHDSGSPGDPQALCVWARDYARELLEPLGSRWQHTQAVAATAERFAGLLDDTDSSVLVAAAYLHDLGYAAGIPTTGFHALDGARHLRDLSHPRLAGLVAHHTGAIYEAILRGLSVDLTQFPNELSRLTAALAFCDITNGPEGQPMTTHERLGEVERRYGWHHLVPTAVRSAWPYLVKCVSVAEALRDVDDEWVDIGLCGMVDETQPDHIAERLGLDGDPPASRHPGEER